MLLALQMVNLALQNQLSSKLYHFGYFSIHLCLFMVFFVYAIKIQVSTFVVLEIVMTSQDLSERLTLRLVNNGSETEKQAFANFKIEFRSLAKNLFT